MKKENFRFYWEQPEDGKGSGREGEKGKEGFRMDVPGFTKDEIRVSVTDNSLTVSASKKGGKVDKGKGFYREERFASSFSKSITLPQNLDKKEFEIEISDGAIILKRRKKKAIEKVDA